MKLHYSKILTLLLIFTFFVLSGTTISAQNLYPAETITTESLDNGDYIETTIISNFDFSSSLGISTFSTSKTISKTKTAKYKNSAGTVLWSVSIKATFTYNGSSSKCTSCSHSTTAPSKYWSIKSCTSSKSGNKATAKAIAIHSNVSSETITKSVTIQCGPTGKIS